MSYIMNRDDAYDLACYLGVKTKLKGEELSLEKCPYCHSTGRGDSYTFAINLKSGAFKCLRGSCGKQGHFVELCRDVGWKLDFGETVKPYRVLPNKKPEPKPEAIQYLLSRGISEDIAKRYHITVQTNSPNILVIPFYDDEGSLQCVKYRKTDFDKEKDKNKEWFERNCKHILFGMDQAQDYTKPLVITEGQMDALALATAGIVNPVSVPNGATSFDNWMQNCGDYLQKFDKVIVFGDFEKGKRTLIDEIDRRLTNVSAVRIEDYLGEKDANDILRKFGPEQLRKAIENAEPIPVNSIKRLADVEAVDLESCPHICTGFASLDEVLGGIYAGQLMVLSGRRGEGKSTFMSQIVANALDKGYSVLAYSGELAGFHFREWLDKQLAGAHNMDMSKFTGKTTIPADIRKSIGDWYRDRMFIFDDAAETDTLLADVERFVKRNNIKLVCLDNLMSAMESRAGDDIYQAQGNFVGKVKKICMRTGCCAILVCHPRKTNAGDIGNDDISGSADITNKADIVCTYSRAGEDCGCDSTLTVTKNRIGGKLVTGKNAIRLSFKEADKRIYEEHSAAEHCRYGWECSEPLTEEPEGLPF